MTIWQRRARIAAAAVGIGCAVAIFYYGRAQPRRDGPAKAPPPIDPGTTSQAGPGNSLRLRAGKKPISLEFANRTTYSDGRVRFEKVHGRFEEGDELWADALETRGKTEGSDNAGRFDLQGNVRIRTGDGLSLETASAIYDDATGVATMPGAVKFSRGRLSGSGMGATYQRDQQTMTVLDQSSFNVAPDEKGADAITATSKTMILSRVQKSLRMEQGAKIVRTSDTLSGDAAILLFTDDEKAVRFLELRGNATITPAAGSDSPDMRAHDITLGFHPDGRTMQHARLTGNARLMLGGTQAGKSLTASWIDLGTGTDGKTLRSLEARDGVILELPAGKDVPARTIKSATLASQGDDSGLKSAHFDGGVTFQEVLPAPAGQRAKTRTATSQVLVLRLAGQIDAIDEAEFRQNVEFVDGNTKGHGEIGKYFAKNERLTLMRATPASKAMADVTDGKFTAVAETIDVALGKNDLTAKGDVRTVTTSEATGDARTPGLFQPGKRILGSAAALTYSSANRKAEYTGAPKAPARVQEEGGHLIIGDRIIVDDTTRNLQAIGNVDSKFLLTPETKNGAAPGKPTEYRAIAQSLDYNDAARSATYVGNPAKLTSTDGETEGRKITLFLAKEGRSVDKLTVDEAVYAKLSGNHEVIGDRLTYDAATNVYVVTGKTVVGKSPSEDGNGCMKSTGTHLTLDRKTNAVSWKEHDDRRVVSVRIKCEESIRVRAGG